MRAIIAKMARELCSSLAERGRAGRTIGIKVRLDDFTTVTRAHSVPEPTCDEQVVCAHALRLLREYAPQRPVRLLGVRVAGLAGFARAARRIRRERRRRGRGVTGACPAGAASVMLTRQAAR